MYGYQRFLQYVDDVGDLKNNVYNNLELLEKITPKKVYEYYKDTIINNNPICIVYGDVTEEYINNLYYKYFKINNSKIIINKDYDCYLKPNKEVNYIEETSKYNQSVLYMTYKIEEMTEHDKLYLGFLCNILNSGETNLIFKKLRSENNLIYSYKFERHIKKGLFFIEAYIDKSNKEQSISAIKEIFVKINNIDIIKEYIDEIIELVEKIYNEIDKQEFEYALPNVKEQQEIVKKEDKIYKDIKENFIIINYKINVSSLTPFEKVKLTFYIDYFLTYNFDETSNAYKKLIDEKISINNIGYNYYFIDEYLIIGISTYTDKFNEFIELINNTINSKNTNIEDFEIRKKECLFH